MYIYVYIHILSRVVNSNVPTRMRYSLMLAVSFVQLEPGYVPGVYVLLL